MVREADSAQIGPDLAIRVQEMAAVAGPSFAAVPPPSAPVPNGSDASDDVDLASLTTRAAVQAHLAALNAHEARLDEQLTTLISSRARLSKQLKALQTLREVVQGIEAEAEGLSNEVRLVAETAERVGGKVRVLDEEQVRDTDHVQSISFLLKSWKV